MPVIATFLALSLLAYALLLFTFQTHRRFDWRFDWRVVAAIFLTCWISLDLIWQGRLLRQLGATYETFYGKDKLSVGPDAKLVEFIVEIKQELEPENSRVFVSSTDDYLGMRGAYYLYPRNVFWQRYGGELPHHKYFHSGDYIVLIQPTGIRFDPLTKKLLIPKRKSLSVEPVVSRRMGSLFRVQ